MLRELIASESQKHIDNYHVCVDGYMIGDMAQQSQGLMAAMCPQLIPMEK